MRCQYVLICFSHFNNVILHTTHWLINYWCSYKIKHHKEIVDVLYQQEQQSRCHQWNRNCLPFRSTCVHPQLSMGLGLQFSVQCFVDYCLSFCLWSLYCLSFFDIRRLITHLVYSNFSYPIAQQSFSSGHMSPFFCFFLQ